jgi:hypothetical protein
MPSSMLLKTVTMTPIKYMGTSSGEIFQNLRSVFGEVIRSPTAWMITADSAALGM